MERIAGIRVDVDADISGLKRALADANTRLNSLEGGFKGSGKAAKGMGGAIGEAETKLAGLLSVGAAISLGTKVIAITSEFQKLNAVLANTLGGATQGALGFAKIQDFAARTNFSVLQVTDAFVKLANGGFKPTTRELENLADLANSTGKDFNQLAEAIIDAQTGEFERLKEFGILARKNGDQVSLTFKEQTTTIDNTSDALRDYIVGLGDLNGVSGATEAISKTLGGQISNLGDAFGNLFNTLGDGNVLPGIVSGLTDIVKATTRALQGEREYQRQLGLRESARTVEEAPNEARDLSKRFQDDGVAKEEADARARAALIRERMALNEKLMNQEFAMVGVVAKLTAKSERFLSTANLKAVQNKQIELDAIGIKIDANNAYIASLQELTNGERDATNDKLAKGKVAEAEAISDAQQKIIDSIRGTYKEFELAAVNAKILGEEQDILAKQTGILESGITKLTDLGLRPGNKALDEMIAKYRQLGQSDLTKLQKNLSGVNPIENTPIPKLGAAGEIPIPEIPTDKLKTAIDEYQAQMARIPKGNAELNASIAGANEQFRALMGQAAASLAQGTADMVGALAAGEEVTGKQVVGFLGSIARQIGAGMIAIGAKMMFVPATQPMGLAYIGGGIALTAVGAALSAGNIPGKGGGKGGGGASAAPVTGGFSAPVTANTAASTASPTRSTQPAAGTGTTSTELTISGKLQISDEGGALVGYIDKQKVKLSRTGG